MLGTGCSARVMGDERGGGGRGDSVGLEAERMAATRASVVVWRALVMERPRNEGEGVGCLTSSHLQT